TLQAIRRPDDGTCGSAVMADRTGFVSGLAMLHTRIRPPGSVPGRAYLWSYGAERRLGDQSVRCAGERRQPGAGPGPVHRPVCRRSCSRRACMAMRRLERGARAARVWSSQVAAMRICSAVTPYAMPVEVGVLMAGSFWLMSPDVALDVAWMS